jgi:deoxycytidine triphosphate deaminase
MAEMKTKREAINTNHDTVVPPGMLSSPQIAYYVEKYKIIKGFEEECLGPASYHMRIGGSVLTWVKGEKIEFELGKEDDKNKSIQSTLELRPNSLTFVTTIESFALPKDIIARFNLKSKWVHEGILLGTGPIVDPELNGNLLIPLHNFSNQNVSLNYGEEFISVEFTKTLNPDQKLPTPHEKCKYVKNKHSDFDFHKYRKRIGGKTVESSVLSTLENHGKIIENYEKRLSIFTWVGFGTFAAVFIAIIALVVTTWSLISSSLTTANEAENIVKQYKGQNFDFRSFALKSSLDEQEKKITILEKGVDSLNNRTSTSSTYLLNQDIQNLKKKIDELDKKISSQTP